MKANQLSRLELLQWLNEFTECDYPRVETCSDGVGYCQVMDAIHPGCINLSKLNFNAKFADEYSLNLKMLDDTFKKLRLDKIIPVDKLSKGKFQDNINFLQWLNTYSSKIGPQSLKNYNGYEKRLDALSKQKHNKLQVMNTHLIPNNAFLNFKPQKTQEQQYNYDENTVEESQNNPKTISQNFISNKPNFIEKQQQQQSISQPSSKVNQLEEFQKELEIDLKSKMEQNWKLLYALDDMIYQRNTLYNILCDIEKLCNKFEPSQSKHTVLSILGNMPSDFQSTDKNISSILNSNQIQQQHIKKQNNF